MTEIELQDIENRYRYATKGFWIPMIEGLTHISGDDFIMTNVLDSKDYKNPERGKDIYIENGTKEDLIFIANAKQDIPNLIKEIRKLKAIINKASC